MWGSSFCPQHRIRHREQEAEEPHRQHFRALTEGEVFRSGRSSAELEQIHRKVSRLRRLGLEKPRIAAIITVDIPTYLANVSILVLGKLVVLELCFDTQLNLRSTFELASTHSLKQR
jgi:hypothetical protein